MAVASAEPAEVEQPAEAEEAEEEDLVAAEALSFEAKLLKEAIARSQLSTQEEKAPEVERVRWSKVREKLRPTQSALGYDWCFYKLKNFTSEAAAQRYMDSKARPASRPAAPTAGADFPPLAQPVPYVQRGKNKYVVDHHHTLAALELFCKSTETDLYVTMERIRQFDKSEQNSLTDEAFWGVMEGKGWAFLRDENYNRSSVTDLPLDFALSSFRNDIYRSMGGFARVYEVLKRGKELDDMLFFEFRWGCAFFSPFFGN